MLTLTALAWPRYRKRKAMVLSHSFNNILGVKMPSSLLNGSERAARKWYSLEGSIIHPIERVFWAIINIIF